MKFADLHIHTLFSDGTSTPEEVIREAKSAGLEAIAIADHDTVQAITPALNAARQESIEFIPAIELSAEYDSLEVHMLGYYIDHESKKLLEKLDFLRANRVARIHAIVEKLSKMGLNVTAQQVFDVAGCGVAGRLHVARAMVKKGLVNSIFEAFEKYIGDKRPAYVCGFRFSPLEAIQLIKEAGGVAVLAHPYLLKRDELIPRFVEYGLQGLEVWYPEYNRVITNFYLEMARQYNLIATGGSDFHGQAKPDVKLGSMKVPYEAVENLKRLRL
jgi:hypothetical protein